jgi:hypothetical protein
VALGAALIFPEIAKAFYDARVLPNERVASVKVAKGFPISEVCKDHNLTITGSVKV